MGALQVLGFRAILKDKHKVPIFLGKHLNELEEIEIQPVKELEGVTFEISCDVSTKFLGPQGAVACFSSQKGASEEDKLILESGMHKVTKFFVINQI
jgi:glycerate kinase